MDVISPSRLVRAANARVVLEHVWDADAVTGTDLIAATGLSRATVHDVCEELIDLGWETCARVSHPTGGGRPPSAARQEIVSRTVLDALADVPAAPSSVLAVAVGVPAPVAGTDHTAFGGNDYWASMNPGIAEHLT